MGKHIGDDCITNAILKPSREWGLPKSESTCRWTKKSIFSHLLKCYFFVNAKFMIDRYRLHDTESDKRACHYNPGIWPSGYSARLARSNNVSIISHV